jgi:hypothetical protein
VILLFNTSYGIFPDDVPFNLDRQRLSPYEFAVQSKDPPADLSRKQRAAQLVESRGPLFRLLMQAIGSILSKRPAKPRKGDELTAEERKKRHDRDTLQTLVQTFHVPTLDDFLEDIQTGSFSRKIFHFWVRFDAFVLSSLFHLYDRRVNTLVNDLHKSWAGTLSFGHRFHVAPSGNRFIFTGRDIFRDEQEEREWKRLMGLTRQVLTALPKLLKHIRRYYPEIDIERASREAWAEFVDFEQDAVPSRKEEDPEP